MVVGEHNFIEVRAFHGWPEGSKQSIVLVSEFSCEVSAVQQARGLQGDTEFFSGAVCGQGIAEFLQGFAYQLLEVQQLFREKLLFQRPTGLNAALPASARNEVLGLLTEPYATLRISS